MSLNILLVDDQAQDRALVRRELTKHFEDVDFVEVAGPEDLDRAFGRNGFDLVISDYALGWGDGLRILHSVAEQWPWCGTIMYTGTGNEEVAVAAMKAGFDDYVVKSHHHLKRLPEVVRRTLERQRREEAEGRDRAGRIGDSPADDAAGIGAGAGAAARSGPSDRGGAEGESAAMLRLLQAVTSAANGAERLTDALEVVLPELCLEVGWPVAHAWRTVPEAEGRLESSELWCLFDPIGFDGFRRATARTRLDRNEGLPGRAIRAGGAVWVEDMGRAVDSPRASDARRAGIGAAAAVPILVDSEPVAVLEFFHRQPQERDEAVLELLEQAAAQLGRVATRERAEQKRTKLQERILTARRMEAIGRLAGGLAHDFNNLLNVVTLEVEDALGDTELPPTVRSSLGIILKTAERAAGLTRRLLTFGRRTPGQPAAVDAGEMVRDMQHLLDHILGSDVTLGIRLEGPVAAVRVDRSQLEHVIVNLILNARDALPEGGEVAVVVRPLQVPETPTEDSGGLEPGDWIVVSVSDNGPGIPHGIRDRVFEPFVSTRSHGPGTGLGLSVCHALVQEMGGEIRLDSGPGKGTTVEVLLPADTGEDVAVQKAAPRRTPEGESILVVQDEEDLRSVLARLLTSRGYEVMSVGRGEEAMELLEEGRRFDLLIADVGLPGIQGPELAQRARTLIPDAGVILTTGHSEMAADPDTLAELEVDDVVAKPFTLDELLARMSRALDRRRDEATRAS